MKKFTTFAVLAAITLAVAPGAEARKQNGGNPLPAPVLVDASLTTGECDGDELTIDDACVSVTFTKLCGTDVNRYSVDVTNGFSTDDDDCVDTSLSDNTSVAAEACTLTLNCDTNDDMTNDAECQTALVPVGTTTLCVDDGDGIVDCVNDLEDVEVSSLSTCAKVKGLNPAKKGPKAISQSTPFSNTICPDANDECF